MIFNFNTSGFNHISEIEFEGRNYKSSYNHNYYTNGSELIFEECDDAECFSYYKIINGTTEYLGCIYDYCGIFYYDSQNEFELIQD